MSDSKEKFTPGPWKIQKSISGVHPIAAPGIRAHITYVNDVENAHLIAAAPEMYEALEALISAMDDVLYNADRVPDCIVAVAQEAMDKANAALKKARGEK